ncbi:ABC transporter ATP-binding protein [Clostridium sp. 19966]|uniref:ABC transporter ATP-binding protein n=1 Tax=Clostridium sp. 19966 TaxID=2768166 RepID=UPI0028E05CDD|nr:ABC transporter ATP-binding protein [Clostridium sp. 19966]MDT8718375.1 ABC transporter ATP-binding protein [Clostridium sp. 19966]
MSYIKLKNISKIYGKKPNEFFALNSINLEIHEGEMTAIMGPSGSGKSTLLNMLGCMDVPTSGEYILNGINLTKTPSSRLNKMRNEYIGFVFQYFALIKDYSAIDNVMLPLKFRRMSYKERKSKACEFLDKVGLSSHAKKTPKELSGGQQQRVAIARALVTNPKLILADEPTGNLDSNTGKEILELMTSLNQSGQTIVIVTHDISVASKCHSTINIIDGQIK